MPVLRAGDAGNLYARAHDAVLGVLSDDRVRVALDYTRPGTSRFARLVGGYLLDTRLYRDDWTTRLRPPSMHSSAPLELGRPCWLVRARGTLASCPSTSSI